MRLMREMMRRKKMMDRERMMLMLMLMLMLMNLGLLDTSRPKTIPCTRNDVSKKYIEVRNPAMLEVDDAQIPSI